MWLFGSKTPVEANYLRTASPNECRCIVRESFDFYRALVVGGIYQFSKSVDTKSIFAYAYALRQCIDRHPQLSIIVANSDTNSPYYTFCPRLDLSQHIKIFESGKGSELKNIERVLPEILDEKWQPSIPAWKIVVLPFSDKRCFIGFSFSHSLGDGISGLAFNGTFLNALQESRLEEDLICTPNMKKLSPAFDTAENLPISWSFLISPLLGEYLPRPIASLFGFAASASSVTPGTWTGSPIFNTPETSMHRTGIEILSIDAATVKKAIKSCRTHGAKLTGLIHQFILTALSESLPQPNTIDNFAAATAIDMRSTVGISKDEMGLFVSGDFTLHPIQKANSETDGEFSWALAKSITNKLAAGANTLQDQPIGLLRYLADMRSWTSSKLGHRRDSSYAISNLVSFQPSGPMERCSVTEMVFSQPTDVTSAPLTFNIVSTANGPMNITIDWQFGALDVGSHADEAEFVRKLCLKISSSFNSLR